MATRTLPCSRAAALATALFLAGLMVALGAGPVAASTGVSENFDYAAPGDPSSSSTPWLIQKSASRAAAFENPHSNISPSIAIDNGRVGSPLTATTLVVDDDGAGILGNCNDPTPTYSTISAAVAVASPGDVIHVCPGTYPEVVTITIPLSLMGSGSGSTFIDPGPAGSTVVTIAGVAGDVTVDGFTIATGNASAVNSNALSVAGIAAGATVTITHNVLTCWQSAAGTANENYGLIAGYGSEAHLVFDSNTVNGGGDNPVLLELWRGPVDFTNNMIYRGPNDATLDGMDAVFVMNHDAPDITTRQRFDSNTIDVGGGTLFDPAHRCAGITIATQVFDGTGPGGYTDVQLTNNNVVNLKTSRRGLALWNSKTSGSANIIALIKGNTVTPAPASTGEFGVQVLGGITGTMITENDISGTGKAVRARNWNGFDPSAITATGNDLSGNTVGVQILGGATVDASANWWGTNTEAGVATMAGPAVDYTPWLDVGTDTGGAPGFQGSFSILHVGAGGPQTGGLNRIQEGINLVTASTVIVGPGTYFGNIVIATNNLTLNGANAGVDARGPRGPESIIDSSFPSGSAQVQANNVTIDGFKFNNAAFAVLATVDCSNLTVRNCYVDGASTDGINYWRANSGTISRNLVENAAVCGITAGDDRETPSLLDDLRTNASITENKVVNCSFGISGYQMGSTVTNNDVIGLAAAAACGICGQWDGVVVSGNSVSGYTTTGFGGVAFGASATYPNRANSQNNTITLNTITGNAIGMGFDAISTGGTNVNNNNISGNAAVGLGSLAAGALNASCNWWGNIGGPDAPPAHPNPLGDDVLGNVVYWPWLNAAAPGGACNQFGPDNVAASTSGLCISTPTPCVTVPVVFNRADTGPARAASVTFTLSSNLELCGTPGASVLQGPWLSGFTTSFQVVSNGGGSYTVDQAILGTPCGVTAGGTLFTIRVKKATAAPDGNGTITVAAVNIRDCGNPFAVLPGIPGAPATLLIDTTPPTPVADLAAAQKLTGNDTNGTTKIQLTFTAPGDAAVVEVYRKGFGDYPEYDDGTGTPVTPPGSYPPAGWTLTGVTASGGFDEPATRDFWSYAVYTKDACGNISLASNMTAGTLNYHLGDVSDGTTPGAGNNAVGTEDISLLGAHYGITLAHVGDPFNYLDVGPTTNNSTHGRPLTDDRVNFDDLVMFAINYGAVSLAGPPPGLADLAGGNPWLALRTEPTPDGVLARLFLVDNPGNVKGIHALVAFDRTKLTLLAVEQGDLLGAQGQPVFFRHLDEGAAGIHAAVLGQGIALHGSGEIARLRFRGAGAPALALADLRDLENRAPGAPAAVEPPAAAAERPAAFALLTARPNPFNPSTLIGFQLSAAARAELRIYDIGGRLVRTLVEGELAAGEHAAFWDGRDGRGQAASSGVYIVNLRAGGRLATHKIQLMK